MYCFQKIKGMCEMQIAKSQWSRLGWVALTVAAIVAMGTAPIANAGIIAGKDTTEFVFSGKVDKVYEEVSGTGVTTEHFFTATLLFDNNAAGTANGKVDKPAMLFKDALLSLKVTYYDAARSPIYWVSSTGPAAVTVKDEETRKDGTIKQKDEVKSKDVSVSGKSVESVADPIAGTMYEFMPTHVDITIDASGLAGHTLDDFFAAGTFEGKVDLEFLAYKDDGKSMKKKIKGKIIPVPEPGALALFALGLLALGVSLRQRRGSNT